MIEYRVVWCQCPTNFNPTRVLFVEAANPEDAQAIARDHIERAYGIEWLKIDSVEPVKPKPAGRVIESVDYELRHNMDKWQRELKR